MSNRIKIGVLTFGDGRKFIAKDLFDINAQFQKMVKTKLESEGFQVYAPEETICSNEKAYTKGRRLPQSPSEKDSFLWGK